MLIQLDPEEACPEWPSSAVCIGTFDGLHLGHRELVKKTVELATNMVWPAGIVTFDRNPLNLLRPEKAPIPIRSVARNLQMAAELGISFALVLPFTLQLSQTSAADFLTHILLGACHAEKVIVGQDFAMGHGREGTATWLAERMETEIMSPVLYEGTRVSSTQIRGLLSEGQIEAANSRLGEPFTIEGTVISGEKLGRKLGFPTINIARFSKTILPLDGVYAGFATTRFGRYAAAISLGNRPAIGQRSYSIEAHLLDYGGDSLYGTAVKLELTKEIRGQMKFDSLESLRAQIAKDCAEIKTVTRI